MSNVSLTTAIPMLLKAVPRSRNFEAVLLFWVSGIHAFALAQVQLSVLQKMQWDLLFYWGLPTMAALVMHYILRKHAVSSDGLLLPLAFLLNGLGIAMIYRLDLAEMARGSVDLYAERQVWLTCFYLWAWCSGALGSAGSARDWPNHKRCNALDWYWRPHFPARGDSQGFARNILCGLFGFAPGSTL